MPSRSPSFAGRMKLLPCLNVKVCMGVDDGIKVHRMRGNWGRTAAVDQWRSGSHAPITVTFLVFFCARPPPGTRVTNPTGVPFHRGCHAWSLWNCDDWCNTSELDTPSRSV